jgi:hypothetical protein
MGVARGVARDVARGRRRRCNEGYSQGCSQIASLGKCIVPSGARGIARSPPQEAEQGESEKPCRALSSISTIN